MRFLHCFPGYAHTLYRVKLEAIDVGRSDADLITEVDNRSDYKNMNVHHFGGTVERFMDGTAYVKVYTD